MSVEVIFVTALLAAGVGAALGLAVFFRRAGGFSVDLHLGPLWVEVRVGRGET
ncbi:MAG: hypothetical protein BWY25_03125 [Chloroflexi bacterium ADurb.Bin222]|nr:MAG: hypothetical protein BWY25_03125 [Chloroflexi bacterium ADurb.Bin222]